MFMKIPKPDIVPDKLPVLPKIDKSAKLLFSYRLLELDHEYYSLAGLCDKGVQHWVKLLKSMSDIEANRLLAGEFAHGTLRFHQHRRDGKHEWPHILEARTDLADDFCQLRFGKSNGGIHGVLIDNVFYIIWFDPRHLYYHDAKFGPKTKLSSPGDCCIERDSIIEKLNAELATCRKELESYKELVERETSPT